MCLNLKKHLLKTNGYSYRSTYINPMLTTKQKPRIEIQKLKSMEHKHITKEKSNHREETKRRKEERRTTETMGKQVI